LREPLRLANYVQEMSLSMSTFDLQPLTDSVELAGVESGGDMAGSVFNRQADMDYFALMGNEFLTWIE
jgi:hypothetical protein